MCIVKSVARSGRDDLAGATGFQDLFTIDRPRLGALVAIAVVVCSCAGDGGEVSNKPATDAPPPVAAPAAPTTSTGRVERASIHPDLPEFSFTLEGEVSEATQSVERIVIRAGAGDEPLQTLEGFATDTPIHPGEPLLEVLDMNFDGYGDLRIIEFLPAGPNVPYLNWLYDPEAGVFVHAEELDAIPAPTYDAVAQRINSSWRDGATRYGFDTYQWLDGRPIATRKEIREYLEPGVYERTVLEPQGDQWTEVEKETVRE